MNSLPFSVLYCKHRSSRDAIIIYGINQHLDLMQINELLYEKQEAVIE